MPDRVDVTSGYGARTKEPFVQLVIGNFVYQFKAAEAKRVAAAKALLPDSFTLLRASDA